MSASFDIENENSKWVHIAGLDSAHGGVEKYTKMNPSSGDDSSIATLRARLVTDPVTKEKYLIPPAKLINVFRKTGLSAGQFSFYIHRLDQYFKYDLMIIDPGGGGLFVMDELRKPSQTDGRDSISVTPIITEDELRLRGVGQNKLIVFGRGDPRLKRLGYHTPSESSFPNFMHTWFKGALERIGDEIAFPKKWDGWDSGIDDDPDAMREWLNSKELPLELDCMANIDLALAQIPHISRVLDNDGTTPKLDRHGLYEFTSAYKKDAAYSLIYAYFGYVAYKTELKKYGSRNGDKVSHIFDIEEV